MNKISLIKQIIFFFMLITLSQNCSEYKTVSNDSNLNVDTLDFGRMASIPVGEGNLRMIFLPDKSLIGENGPNAVDVEVKGLAFVYDPNDDILKDPNDLSNIRSGEEFLRVVFPLDYQLKIEFDTIVTVAGLNKKVDRTCKIRASNTERIPVFFKNGSPASRKLPGYRFICTKDFEQPLYATTENPVQLEIWENISFSDNIRMDFYESSRQYTHDFYGGRYVSATPVPKVERISGGDFQEITLSNSPVLFADYRVTNNYFNSIMEGKSIENFNFIVRSSSYQSFFISENPNYALESCPEILEPGESCVFSVYFNPSELGVVEGVVATSGNINDGNFTFGSGGIAERITAYVRSSANGKFTMKVNNGVERVTAEVSAGDKISYFFEFQGITELTNKVSPWRNKYSDDLLKGCGAPFTNWLPQATQFNIDTTTTVLYPGPGENNTFEVQEDQKGCSYRIELTGKISGNLIVKKTIYVEVNSN